jgi:hypothetical protein
VGLAALLMTLAVMAVVPVAVAANLLRLAPTDHEPRTLVTRRECVLRGVTVALLLATFATLQPRKLETLAAIVVAFTIGLGVWFAGLVEREAARRDGADEGAIVVGIIATFSVPIAACQGTYALATLRSGPEAGLTTLRAFLTSDGAQSLVVLLVMATLLWGIPCGVAARRRIREGSTTERRHGDPSPDGPFEDTALLLVLLLCAPIPGYLLIVLASWLARSLDARLSR